ASQEASTSAPADTLGLGELGLTKTPDGRYHTRARGYAEQEYSYIFGDLTGSEATVKLLHKADREKFYQSGDCGVLANELWTFHEHVTGYYCMVTDGDPSGELHEFVKLTDGSYADSLGLWSEAALLAFWRAIEPT
ncbi:hypothetical protein, partial [Escherichia coli]|uniref:hypothetical protein n=1 Tax=Escherichia coli TaxID=562 RepID=UPI0013036303